MCWLEPLVDGRYEDGRLVADRQLVVPRGHGSMPLEAVDAAFHGVPLAVVDRVELRRAATVRAAPFAVADLIGRVRDGATDATPSQIGAVRPRGIRLIRADPPRPGTRAARPQARNPDTAQDDLELRAVTSLPGGDGRSTRAVGTARGPGAAWWSARRTSAPSRDRPPR